jgi:arsenate reductase-like glutaredoxin family protein
MVHRIGKILARFPESEDLVRKLIQDSRGFETLCQDYSNTSRELGDVLKLKQRDLAAEADALQKRRTAVEEEILATIEGYEPA